MTPLEKTLHRKIAVDGPMRFDAYMQACLSLSDEGYYQHQQAIGQRGDFVTAPEISQIFGEMIGVWLLDRWFAMGKPKAFTLLELGPGRGTLMSDALRLISKIEPAFISAMNLAFYEQNQVLRSQQQSKLSTYTPTWLEDLGDGDHLNADTPLLVISNEFFDALPVRLFKFEQNKWCEIAVDSQDEKLVFAAEKLNDDLSPLMPDLKADGSCWFEFCPSAIQIFADLSKFVVAAGGAMLTVDYGYSEQDHKLLSVQAVKDHQMVELFHRPSETDLSAHVDFGLLAKTAHRHGAQVWPLMTQAEMLLSLGAEQRLEQLTKLGTPEQVEALRSGFDRLVADDQMGRLFKVLCVSDKSLKSWAGA